MSQHLETFLAHARETYEAPLPRYVEEELRGYLRCGDFLRGFVHCRCEACGHDLVVAFSCKGRAACPSCAAAAHTLKNIHVGEVTEPAMVRLVLESLGMPAEGPRIARARDPTELLGEEAEA